MAYDGIRNPASHIERRGFSFCGYRLDTTTTAIRHVFVGYLEFEDILCCILLHIITIYMIIRTVQLLVMHEDKIIYEDL